MTGRQGLAGVDDLPLRRAGSRSRTPRQSTLSLLRERGSDPAGAGVDANPYLPLRPVPVTPPCFATADADRAHQSHHHYRSGGWGCRACEARR
jgi:hypothetical protein